VALQRASANRLDDKTRTKQPAGPSGDHHFSPSRLGLQPRREVWRGADNCVLLCASFADQIPHDNEAGGDSNPGAELFTCRTCQSVDRLRGGKSGSGSAFCIVLMGARPAKICEYAIAHQFGHMPTSG
jgi:hypothetical protein